MASTNYYSDTQKFRPVEDDGLQLDTSRSVNTPLMMHDHEGLQAVSAPMDQSKVHYYSGVTGMDSHKEPYKLATAATPALASAPASAYLTPATLDAEKAGPRGSFAKRRRWLILGGVIGVLVLLAIILGAVLGTKASHKADDGGSTAGAQSGGGGGDSNVPASQTQNTRVRSTSGAWNGTGLTSLYAHHKGFWTFLFYQDYTGALVALQWTMDDSGAPIRTGKTTIATAAGPVKAANGTGLAAVRYNDRDNTDVDKFNLVYVAPNNTLCDLWLADNAMDDSGRISGFWTEGVLSQRGFKAPTDNRPAMHMFSSDVWYGDKYNASGNAGRLWAGGMDGKLHQYSWKGDGGDWYDKPYDFSDSYGYGSVFAMAATAPNGYFNTTLYTTAADGTVQYRVQSNNNQTQWPVGGSWSDPVSSQFKAAPNSTTAAQWETAKAWGSWVYYPTNDGKMGAVSLALDQADSKQWGQPTTKYQTLPIMQGSDMTHDSNSHGQLVMYQKAGNDISWQYFANSIGISGTMDLS